MLKPSEEVFCARAARDAENEGFPLALTSSALLRCFESASAASQPALRRCLDQTIVSLQTAQVQARSQNERIELGEAWRDIAARGRGWCERYPAELRKAFNADAQPAPPAASPSRAQPDEMVLVSDAHVVEGIESSRLLQHVLPLVERGISELDALVSSAIGQATVRPDLNPMRPEVFAQALRSVIGPNETTGPPAGFWMKYLAVPLGQELQAIYAGLVVQLQQANVQAAGYRVAVAASTSPVDLARPQPDAPAAGPARAATWQGGELSSRELSQALLREFLVHGLGAEASQALPQSYYAGVERELAQLRDQPESAQAPLQPVPASYRALPAVDRPARSVGVQSSLDAQVWGPYARSRERSMVRTQLRNDATRVGQVLGLELVRKVVNEVAQDPRLLAPVREAIVALEPSLLRLSMADPRFLGEEAHPARQLMERVAQRSFKYNDEFSTEFSGFFQQLSDRFNALNRAPVENAEPFGQVLQQLEAQWLGDDQAEAERQRPGMETVRFAEMRQAQAERIAAQLGSRPDLAQVPDVVQAFLFGPWSLVMAHARLEDRQERADPEGYAGVITDLLWSVKREVTLKQPAQLFQRVPGLVATLRAGLASIGQDPGESEPFFQALMKLHHPVLKLRRARSRRDALESGAAPLMQLKALDAAVPLQGEASTGLPWMSPRELHIAGFEDTLPTSAAELEEPAAAAPAAPAPATANGDAASEPQDVLSQLTQGVWVDLYSKRRWLRAQLVWASSKGTLFMFVSHGGQPHSMTKRICERLIQEKFLRPVRTHAVVAQALKTLDRVPAADRQHEQSRQSEERAGEPAASGT